MKFTERPNLDLSKVNEEVLADWLQQDLFHKSISSREGKPDYVFYDGPPSANGHPGIHHVMLVRSKTFSAVIRRCKAIAWSARPDGIRTASL